MSKSYFRDFDDKRTPTTDQSEVFEVEVTVGRKRRKITVQVGRNYVVAPTNPASRRHRGRPCQIMELDDSLMPSRAAVRFIDSRGRWAIVNVSDLAEAGTVVDPVAAPEVWSLDQIEKKASLLCARLAKRTTSTRISEARTLLGKITLLKKASDPATAAVCEKIARGVAAAMVQGLATATNRPATEIAQQLQAEIRSRLTH